MKYSPQVETIIAGAGFIALDSGLPHAQPEHIALSLVQDPIFMGVLFKAEFPNVQKAIETKIKTHLGGKSGLTLTSQNESSSNTSRLIMHARDEAATSISKTVFPQHLALAFFREKESFVAQTFSENGLNRERINAAYPAKARSDSLNNEAANGSQVDAHFASPAFPRQIRIARTEQSQIGTQPA